MPSGAKAKSETDEKAGVHVALLRGINVGGKNKLPMKDLVRLFEALDCHDVRTYIQSGNVVFHAKPALARRIGDLMAAAIRERFGYQVPVVLRTAAELERAATENPFLQTDADPKTLHVAFLAARPHKSKVAGLDPKRSAGDSFVVKGQEIYLHCPNGMARTKLTNHYFDRTLDTTSTLRNLRTVQKLVELAAG
ncbi:MAG: DUF1697 domain-containing protein [Deltaproteobacteria bacterium]|nr:DUF1697 domain-containing protein [Deltaproteobacteria bacterium]